MWQVLDLLLDVILMDLVKMARWKELSSATQRDIVKIAKSGQLVLDIAHVLDVNSNNFHRIIQKHSETTTMHYVKCCGLSRKSGEH